MTHECIRAPHVGARSARALVWEHRNALGLAIAMSAASNATGLLVPLALKWFVDEALGHQRWAMLPWLVALVLVAAALQASASYVLVRHIGIAGCEAATTLRKRVYSHAIRMSVRSVESVPSGALVSRIMTDSDGARNLIGQGLVQLVGGTVAVSVGVAVLAWLNWRLTCVIAGVFALYGAVLLGLFRRIQPTLQRRSELIAGVAGHITQVFAAIRTVKAYVAEPIEDRVFAQSLQHLDANARRTVLGYSLGTATSIAVAGAVAAAIIGVGGWAIMHGAMSTGDVVMYAFVVSATAGPLIGLASIGAQMSEAIAGVERANDLLKEPTEAHDERRHGPTPDLRGEIQVDDVWFEYVPRAPILKGAAFTSPAGTTTAIVGASGSGKSTLLTLLMGLYAPTLGRIVIDGRDLTSLVPDAYRRQIAVVLQDTLLFDGSVMDNVLYGNPAATLSAVRRACEAAHCDEFVSRLPDKYDTRVGERGLRLSAGQRQRIAIARAIVADPRILLLDEATSNLDVESELLVQDGLRRLSIGRTTIVIAHRLSTVQRADNIIVLERGRVIEQGSHAKLIAYNGRYRDLYQRQFDTWANVTQSVHAAEADRTSDEVYSR